MTKLLIVDDEPGIRFSIGQVFESDDMQVLGAADADEALQLAQKELPDVTLLDIHLGRQSGLQLIGRLHGVAPNMPVIFITGKNTPDVQLEASRLGAFDYLVKPLDVTQLQEVVRQAIAAIHLHKPAAKLRDGASGDGE